MEGDEFGLWMLVQRTSKARVSRKITGTVGVVTAGASTRTERKAQNRVPVSWYGVLLEWKEDQGTTEMEKLRNKGRNYQGDGKEKTITVYEERRINQGRQGQAAVAENSGKDNYTRSEKGIYVTKAKENSIPEEMRKERGTPVDSRDQIEDGLKAIGQKKKQSPKTMGHRTHCVVSGSMGKMKQKTIS